jgi:hypothetical protein
MFAERAARPGGAACRVPTRKIKGADETPALQKKAPNFTLSVKVDCANSIAGDYCADSERAWPNDFLLMSSIAL